MQSILLMKHLSKVATHRTAELRVGGVLLAVSGCAFSPAWIPSFRFPDRLFTRLLSGKPGAVHSSAIGIRQSSNYDLCRRLLLGDQSAIRRPWRDRERSHHRLIWQPRCPAGPSQLHSKGAGRCRGFIPFEFRRFRSVKQDVDRNDEPPQLILEERLKYGSEKAG